MDLVELARQLEAHIKRLLVGIDVYSMPAAERKVVTALKANATDAKLDIRDYEFGEGNKERQKALNAARKRLERIRTDIAGTGSYNVFNGPDVAHLAAEIEQILERLGE